MGYLVHKSVTIGVDAQQYLEFSEPGLTIVTYWTPWEISLTPIPVDIYAGVVLREKSLAEEINSLKIEIETIKNNGGAKMADEKTVEVVNNAPVPEENKISRREYGGDELASILGYAVSSGLYKDVVEGLMTSKSKDEIIKGIMETQREQREQAVLSLESNKDEPKDSGKDSFFSETDYIAALNI